MKKYLDSLPAAKPPRNRLRRADNFLLMYDAPLFYPRKIQKQKQAYFVDLGYGAEPFTTLESAQRLRRVNPGLPVLGVEIDPDRVETGSSIPGYDHSISSGWF